MSSLILQGRIGGVRISLKSRKEQIKSLQGYVWNSGRSQQVVYDVDVGLRQKNRNWKVICSNSRRSSYIKRKPDINETISKISLGFLVMICVGMVLFSPSQEVPIQVFKASIMVRQQVALLLVFVTVRFMLPSLVKGVRTFFETTEPWEGSNEFHFIQQVSPPLQMMLLCASIFCLAQHVLPSLLPVSSEAIKLTSRRVLSFVCICMTAYIALCMKQRYVNSRNEYVNQKQSTVVDKIVTVLIITGTVVFFLQNLGLDLQSLLTLGGVGGIALGLAGQEILENLLHGVLIISASSFAVGDEVVFWYKDGWKVEGIVMDIGWYRSSIRSFDREVFSIPNATFSKTVVLNVTRKMGEWRIRHDFGLRLEDVRKAPQVVSAIKRILKQDKRVIQKLPIRVFLTGIDREQVNIFMNFFVSAANREDYVIIRQDMLLSIFSCVRRNNAHLATKRVTVQVNGQQQSGINTLNDTLQEQLVDIEHVGQQNSFVDANAQIVVNQNIVPITGSHKEAANMPPGVVGYKMGDRVSGQS